MKISNELSGKLSNMSFVCVVLVVFIHLPGQAWGIVRGALAWIAVPTFFIISGYFLGLRVGESGWYVRAVKKRVRTLLVPFVMLYCLWWPIKYGIHHIGVRYYGADGTAAIMKVSLYNFLSQTGFIPWGGNVVIGTWYLKSLFLMVCLSPLLVLFLKKKVLSLFLVLGLWCMWCYQANIDWPMGVRGIMTYELNMRCPLYFTIGLIFANHVEFSLLRWQKVLMVIAGCVACVVVLYFNPEWHSRPIFIFPSVVLMAACVWAILPAKRFPDVLTRNSFAIFVFHGSVLFLLEKVCRIAQCPDLMLCAGQVPIVVVTISLSILAAEGLKYAFPRFSRWMFGGR